MSDEAVLDTGAAPDRKSLDTPLLIGALVVIAAMAAWFFLGSDDQVIESAPVVEAEPMPEVEPVEAVVATDIANSELLSRARLAADAGMLTEPAGSNALYYYAQFVEQAPDTAAVQQELDAVLSTTPGSTIRASPASPVRCRSFARRSPPRRSPPRMPATMRPRRRSSKPWRRCRARRPANCWPCVPTSATGSSRN